MRSKGGFYVTNSPCMPTNVLNTLPLTTSTAKLVKWLHSHLTTLSSTAPVTQPAVVQLPWPLAALKSHETHTSEPDRVMVCREQRNFFVHCMNALDEQKLYGDNATIQEIVRACKFQYMPIMLGQVIAVQVILTGHGSSLTTAHGSSHHKHATGHMLQVMSGHMLQVMSGHMLRVMQQVMAAQMLQTCYRSRPLIGYRSWQLACYRSRQLACYRSWLLACYRSWHWYATW
jgi:hypothetical protein